MKNKGLEIGFLLIPILALLLPVGCNSAHGDPAAESPPPATVVRDVDVSLFSVDQPEHFPIVTATERITTSKLVVTGTVMPDIARNVPVISLATGAASSRFMPDWATVQKGQLLLSIRSDDVASGFSEYRKAVADEILARA
jgi:cobalt-zinc-cadmium efflux system membrane fusion protein